MVVGTRPNLVKAAPVYDALAAEPGVCVRIAHTGQHYDPNMDSQVAKSLSLPEPAWKTSTHSSGFEETHRWLVGLFQSERPSAVIVIGDVNSTLHAANAAKEAGCTLVHVEAGLRSRDLTMPEERNRIAVDKIADLLLVSEPAGMENLRSEAVCGHSVLVGSCTVDALVRQLEKARHSTVLENLGLRPQSYILCTMHRPANADDREKLSQIVRLLIVAARHTRRQVVWPIHPRTLGRLHEYGIQIPAEHLMVIEPLDYSEFTRLMQEAALVLTDSGGIQEETTYLGVRCITFRDSTERPITIEKGTNDLLPTLDQAQLVMLLGSAKPGGPVEYWDGKAARRCARALMEFLRGHTASKR